MLHPQMEREVYFRYAHVRPNLVLRLSWVAIEHQAEQAAQRTTYLGVA